METSEAAPAAAAQVSTPTRWGAFWKQQQRRWRQYDIISTACTMVLLTGNVARSCGADSSYQTTDSKQALGASLLAYTSAMVLHAWVLWLVTKCPGPYNAARNLLTCARWLLVSCLIVASTPLPVFQAGHNTPSPWMIVRLLQFAFRSGSMFCAHSFTFYLMPWPYMAVMATLYAAASSWAAAKYCTVTAMHLQQQTHADFSIIHSAASILDILVGHGTAQHSGLQSSSGPTAAGVSTGNHALAAAAAGTTLPVYGTNLQVDQPVWQSTSSIVLTAFDSVSMQGSTVQQQACQMLLQGQCHAATITIHFGLTYVMLLLVAMLERYNKWRFLKHQQQQHEHTHHQQQHPMQQQADLTSSHQVLESHPVVQPSSSSSSTDPAEAAGSSDHSVPGHSDLSSQSDIHHFTLLQQRSFLHSNLHGSFFSSQHSSRLSSQRSLLLDPYTAPTAWALLRIELLKLVVLLDVPVLLLWWASSSILRPTAAVQDLVGTV